MELKHLDSSADVLAQLARLCEDIKMVERQVRSVEQYVRDIGVADLCTNSLAPSEFRPAAIAEERT